METILVATDFSKPGDKAVEYAGQLARFLNSKLVIVNAFSLPLAGYNLSAPVTTISEIRNSVENGLELRKDQLLHNSYDFGVEIHADFGKPMDVIMDAANKYGAELIIMGMTGEAGKIKQHIIGSNTLTVSKNIGLPLLIIPEHASYKPIRNICLAAELERIEEGTLIYAARDVASMFNASLEVVTVETGKKNAQPLSTKASSFIDKKLEGINHRQVIIKEEDKMEALEYYFKFHAADMVIVNPKKHNFFKDLFSGSMTRHLAFNITVPLLVLH